MKLSELQQVCKNLAKLSDSDAEIKFMIDDCELVLEAATLDGTAEVDMTQGVLKPAPVWENKVTMIFKERDFPHCGSG